MNRFLRFPGGKCKALTLSYDDGIRQDKRLVEILNKNGLKCTFNINSGMYGSIEEANSEKGRMSLEEMKGLYDGHEVAVHGLEHPFLEQLPLQAATAEILQDRLNLERDFGGMIRGMAYPYGTFNDDVVAAARSCGIAYSRTVKSTGNFLIPTDWLRLNPTCHHRDEKIFQYIETFLSKHGGQTPRLFYLWGHSFEFDWNKERNNWEHAEKIFEMLGGHEDVWYATNIEVYDYVKAYNSLVWSADVKTVHNPTTTEIYFAPGSGKPAMLIKPGETLTI